MSTTLEKLVEMCPVKVTRNAIKIAHEAGDIAGVINLLDCLQLKLSRQLQQYRKTVAREIWSDSMN
jgi:hypothetical protein